MPGIVTEASATFVATTTFLVPRGGRWNTFNWSSLGNDPCIGKIHNLSVIIYCFYGKDVDIYF